MKTLKKMLKKYALVICLVSLFFIPANMVLADSQVLPWGVVRVAAEQVFPMTQGSGVKIAILDSGVDISHPDLKLAAGISLIPGLGPEDGYGHGTLVAGIVAALNNGLGTIGVAPQAEIYSVRVLNEYGTGAICVIQSGIEWSMQNGIDIIYMGMGSGGNWPDSILDALQRAYDAGILIIGGAGNGGTPAGDTESIWAPARYAPVIAVGATDESDARLSDSSTGAKLELVAPGNNAYSTARGGGYATLSQTSAAAAYVTGVAALVKSTNRLSNIQIRQILQQTATDLGVSGPDTQYGHGLVNALKATNVARNTVSTLVAPTTGLKIAAPGADVKPPVTAISYSRTEMARGDIKPPVRVTLTATDGDNGSGVAGTSYSIDGGKTWHDYKSPFTVARQGETTVLARSYDKAGNVEQPGRGVTFVIDPTPQTARNGGVK